MKYDEICQAASSTDLLLNNGRSKVQTKSSKSKLYSNTFGKVHSTSDTMWNFDKFQFFTN